MTGTDSALVCFQTPLPALKPHWWACGLAYNSKGAFLRMGRPFGKQPEMPGIGSALICFHTPEL